MRRTHAERDRRSLRTYGGVEMADKVRVGFIGTGGIAEEAHLPALKEIDGVEIAAVCDTRREQAESIAQQFGGKVYLDHQEMLDREELEALYVCLPPDAHTDAEIIAAAKGIHLFVEKPTVLTMKQGLAIGEAIKQAGVISCVGYQLRYVPVAEAEVNVYVHTGHWKAEASIGARARSSCVSPSFCRPRAFTVNPFSYLDPNLERPDVFTVNARAFVRV